MNKFSLAALAALSISIAGCGANSTPLTEAQKQLLSQTLSSAARGYEAANKARTQETRHERANPFSTFFHFPSLFEYRETPIEPDAVKLMSDEITKADCHIDYQGAHDSSGEPDLGSSSVPNFGGIPTIETSFTVDGDSCPIRLKSSMNMTADQNIGRASMNMTASFSYNVVNASFEQLNDVDAFGLSMTNTMKASQSGGNAVLKLDGQIHSQRLGNIKISGSGKLSGSTHSASGKYTFTLSFPSFVAKLEAKMKASADSPTPTVEYRLNGQKMSEEELKAYFGELMSAASDSGINNGPTL
jgi:hypothetical protein